MATQASIDLAQQLYVAYYGRPADPAGLAFWADAFDAAGDDLTDALAAFGSSSEFTNSFGSLDNTSLIENLYQQLFGHAADAGGLAFYLDRLDTGAATLASIAKQIADGALTTDLDALNNRITVANTFTSTIESTGASYNGAIDIASAQAILGAVDSTAASVTTGNAAATAQASPATFTVTTSGNEVAEGDILTVTVTASKTLGTDTAFSFGLQGDTLDGVIDAATTADYTSTSSGQILILAGQSSTSFGIDIADDSTAEAIEGLNVVILDGDLNVVGEANAIILDAPNLTTGTDDIEILRPDSADTVKGIFDGVGDTLTVGDVVTGNGLTTFNLTLGTSGFAPAVTMTGIDAIEVTATTNATLTIDASTWGSDISSVSLAGTDASALFVNNVDITGTLDVTVGASSSSYVNVTGEMDGAFDYSVSITNDDTDATAGTVALGVAGIDVDAGKNDVISVDLEEVVGLTPAATADGVVGDFTVGNIMLAAGEGGVVEIYLRNDLTDTATAPSVDATVGNMMLGDVTVNFGKSANGDFTATNAIDTNLVGNATLGNFTVGNVDFTLGTAATNSGNLYNQAEVDTGDVTVGDFTIGNINANLGKSADFNFYFTNSGEADTAGDVVVGDVAIGDITMVIGTNATGSFSATNYADSDKGNATVGNMIVGDINLSVAKSGVNDWLGFYNTARADTGDATVGNITFGDITATQATSGDYAIYMGAYNNARVSATGDAIAGNITAGDITITAGDEIDWNGVELHNDARADKGDATVGDITVGDIVMNLGDGGDDSVSLDISNQALVDTSGAATAGDISIGNITANAGSSNSFDISITQDVKTAKGAATIGNVSIGNLSSNLGLDAHLDFNVDVTASGTAGDSVGDITIGNVDVYGQPDAMLDFEIFASAANGSVGTYTLGDVNITLDGDGDLSFENTISAASSIAGVSIGDVNISLGASATFYYFTIQANAGTTLGDVSIGDITITGGLNVSDSDVAGIRLTGMTGIGNVAVGDVTITAGKGGSFDSFDMDVTAGKGGSVGNVTLGNETLSGTVSRSIDVFAGNSIGAVTIGDISVTASGTANGRRYADFTADATSIGDVSIGDVTVAGTAGGSAKVSDFFNAATTVGAVSAGDITLTASGAGGEAYYSLSATAGTSGGSITAGDISLSATASTVNAATSAIADLALVSGKGAVTVGDVTVAGSAAGTGSTPASASIAFSLNAATTVTVGDITVSGGGADNLATLTSWMTTAGTTTTVGNVDYSGYTAAATIDVSALLGAGEIIASSGGSTITDNMTKNIITLGAGADTVNLDANDATTALMPLDTSDATAIDEIIGFTSGVDTLDIETTSGSDTFSFVSGPAADYAAFLAAAEAAMTNFGTDIYAREVDGDIYLAIDDDNVTASGARDIEFVVKLSGITSLDSGDVTIS